MEVEGQSMDLATIHSCGHMIVDRSEFAICAPSWLVGCLAGIPATTS